MHRVLAAWLALAALTGAGCTRDRGAVDDTDARDTDVVRTGCAAEATAPACRACCLDAHPVVATETVVIALLGGCACVQGGAQCRDACADEVADGCRSDARSEVCDTCLVDLLDGRRDQCLDVALDLCAEVAPGACGAVATCLDTCP